MNYYIDFDNTLYNTHLLTHKMLNSIVESIQEKTNIDPSKLYEERSEERLPFLDFENRYRGFAPFLSV